ncbi:amidophosphoribosyltransferase, partial [candidate division KSB1 bacterium]|nr:amidophosphoribosyltransferase [candidate division KSB1 bacterium]
MCGILGVYGHDDVASDLIYGLAALQHRGQDSAGIITLDGNFRTKKGLGHVNTVFKDKNLERLTGNCGIGHVRYATMGSTDLLDAQPYAVNYPFGLAMVHNGNVINFVQLRKSLYEDHHRLLETSNDVALILYSFASELEQKDLENLTVDDIFDTVEAVQNRVKGAFSAITIIANRGFLAFTDPYGIRPIVLGRKYTDKGIDYVFASESTCLDYLGYQIIKDLKPGEAVYIDKQRQVHSRVCKIDRQAFCIFEYIYFAREDSIIHNRLVASERVRMGKKLAETMRKTGLEPDIIIDVPSSAYFFASSMAEELGIPYRRGLAKNNHIGRSFITPNQKEREIMVRQKLNPMRDVIKGKKIAVVDDSIVRGTTSKNLVRMLRQNGAKKIYFVSAAPPIKFPCIYGIDFSIKEEIIAAHYEPDEIARYIEADAVIYQNLEDLRELYADLPCCYACFSGKYPTGVTEEMIQEIEHEKLGS